jgi:GABA(A) receptor-associated protein
MNFKQKYTFEARQKESSRVLNTYHEKIPIICEKHNTSTILNIDKNKYLASFNLSVAHFIYIIRRRMALPSEKAIFIFINGMIPCSSSMLLDYYIRHKDPDGFLYITYASENVFGSIC